MIHSYLTRRRMLKRLFIAAVGGMSSVTAPGCRKSPERYRITGLTPQARSLIAEIAETMLPETDTPGAKTAGVDRFVIRVLNDCRTQRERDQIVKGLDGFEEKCFFRFGHPFIACTPKQKLMLVRDMDGEAFGIWSRIKARVLHRSHFFATLKELIVFGYFTSQQGATQTLAYDAIPGKWVSCSEMKAGQRTWATQ